MQWIVNLNGGRLKFEVTFENIGKGIKWEHDLQKSLEQESRLKQVEHEKEKHHRRFSLHE